MKIFNVLVICALAFNSNFVFAGDDHDHKKGDKPHASDQKGHNDKTKKEDDHDDHEEGEKHADEDGDNHGEEEGNPQVGADKGILEANKEKGFKLSPEAEKNFSINKMKVAKAHNIEIPKSAQVTSGLEINLYRVRDGYYRRIDFTVVSSNSTTMIVNSKELSPNDEIALTGLGFLRISEVSAFDGAPAGHSH